MKEQLAYANSANASQPSTFSIEVMHYLQEGVMPVTQFNEIENPELVKKEQFERGEKVVGEHIKEAIDTFKGLIGRNR